MRDDPLPLHQDAALSFTQRTLLLAMGVLTLMRWMLGAALDITPEEALLVEWGRHPSLAGWEGGFGTALFPWISRFMFDGSFGVRFFAPLLAFLATAVLYRLIHSMAGEKEAAWSVTLLNLTPAFNHGAIYLRPEMAGGLLLLCGMACVWRALRRASALDYHWLLAGAFFGIGGLCWPGVAIGPVTVLCILLLSRRWRRQIFRPGPWLMLADTALLWLPLWFWNHSHSMAGWHHFRESILAAPAPLPAEPLLLCGKWALSTGPFLFLIMLWALLTGLRLWKREDAARFLTVAAGVPLAAALLLSLYGGGRASWITPALPFLCGIVPWAWERRITERLHRKLRLQWACVLPGLLITPLTLNTAILRTAGAAIPPARDPTTPWRGWPATTEEIKSRIAQAAAQTGVDSHGASRLFAIASNEHLASMLNYYLPRSLPLRWPSPAIPFVHLTESPSPSSSYHFWNGYSAPSGMNTFRTCTALYIDDSSRGNPPPRILQAFDSVRPVSVFDIMENGHLLRRIKIYSCINYRGLE